MALPLSKTQVRNLGKRLRDAPTPAPEDLDLLAEVLAAYGRALESAGSRLAELGIASSERLKNTGTIVEKLRRDHASNLPNIQDIAGRRVVLAPGEGRDAQDDSVARIIGAFNSAVSPPRIYDRRVDPRRGYRAVHVVVEVLGLPVEIQVRTAAQHEWAEYFERLADTWGRAIRYEGGQPDVEPFLRRAAPEVDARLRSLLETTSVTYVDQALSLAELIDSLEADRQGGRDRETEFVETEIRRLIASLRDLVSKLATLLEGLR